MAFHMLVQQPRGADVVWAELAFELVLTSGLVVGVVERQHATLVRAVGADGAVIALGASSFGRFISRTIGTCGITLCLAVCAQLLFDLQSLQKSNRQIKLLTMKQAPLLTLLSRD